jgi:mannose-6-phosphate isomerase-like protein (cupin superfamily)
MIKKIESPKIIEAAGSRPKKIEEFVGCVNSETSEISIARMRSPSGWEEPGQQPEFDEYTVVLKGMLRVQTENTVVDVEAGQAIIVSANEWVKYSTPSAEGAEYIAVCLPAFTPDSVNRDE